MVIRCLCTIVSLLPNPPTNKVNFLVSYNPTTNRITFTIPNSTATCLRYSQNPGLICGLNPHSYSLAPHTSLLSYSPTCTFSKLLYPKSFSIRSTCVRSMRLQQYRFNPSASSASFSVLSCLSKSKYGSYLFPITLPQVKHRTGIIIFSFGFVGLDQHLICSVNLNGLMRCYE